VRSRLLQSGGVSLCVSCTLPHILFCSFRDGGSKLVVERPHPISLLGKDGLARLFIRLLFFDFALVSLDFWFIEMHRRPAINTS
jgi:hypothetical protein